MHLKELSILCVASLFLVAGYGILTSYAIYDNALLRDGGEQGIISADIFASEDMTVKVENNGDMLTITVTVESEGILIVYDTGRIRSYISYGDGPLTDEVMAYALEDTIIRVYGSKGIWRTPIAVYGFNLPSDA